MNAEQNIQNIRSEPSRSLKLDQLRGIFQDMDRALIAYSGGIDSTLVAKIAYDILGDRALAMTAHSPSLLPEDLEAAIAQAQAIGIPHEIVETHEMENLNYTTNPINRCYFCKSELHDTLKPIALARGFLYVVDGVNADDLQDYRPGIQAAKERGARSPLAEVGVSSWRCGRFRGRSDCLGGISLPSLV
jgi:pyridinium-3,5-biscarboxylic acid mononucleotide sulfurtransferase